MGRDICPFYLYESTGWFSSKEICKVTDNQISSTTYKNYCYGNYERFPNYKPEQSDSSGGCYLTSACVEAMGLSDDCHELTTLRSFRDHWLSRQEGGREEIAEYYKIAPPIVEKIHSSENSLEVLKRLYAELVRPCVEFIQNGQNESAHALYRATTEMLKKEYL